MKYIAIKVKGLDFWLWFENDPEHYSNEQGKITGIKGWGRNGNYIESFSCDSSEVVAAMYSEALSY